VNTSKIDTFQERVQEASKIRTEYTGELLILGGILVFILGFFLGKHLYSGSSPIIDDSYITNIYTEALGIFATAAVINVIIQIMAKQRLQKILLFRIKSKKNSSAVRAIEDLDANGWLRDKSRLLSNENLDEANLQDSDLRGVNFKGSSLQQTDLSKCELSHAILDSAVLKRATLVEAVLWQVQATHADFENADLIDADLRESILEKANLKSAQLQSAKLTRASLQNANLSSAKLNQAVLTGAHLEDADLSEVDLTGANLSGAYLRNAKIYFEHSDLLGMRKTVVKLDETTVLPDESYYDPSLGLAQLDRFTNPDHPNFFNPDNQDDDSKDEADTKLSGSLKRETRYTVDDEDEED